MQLNFGSTIPKQIYIKSTTVTNTHIQYINIFFCCDKSSFQNKKVGGKFILVRLAEINSIIEAKGRFFV